MSKLIEYIVSDNPEIRNQSLETFCSSATIDELLNECKSLEEFRMTSNNLYEQVRALFFLYAIHRFYLPMKKGFPKGGTIPFDAYEDILYRRFEEAIQKFLSSQKRNGPSDGLSSALAEAYRNLGFQTLANQVKVSVRSVRGNQWMFRIGHPSDHPLRIKQVLTQKKNKLYPILHEQTPVRMDLSHSGWSDIFFLGMDFPEGARVLNISIDLSVRGGERTHTPQPPVEVFFRVIEEPIIRLVSTDLGAVSEITTFRQLFDFAADYLGLLKAAVIASGIVPSSMEGTNQPIADLLEQLVGTGLGIEIVSQVNGIPKGSRLAVSTTLLASIITACMRATGQIGSLTGSLSEIERRTVAARAILGEWLGGSGGGWQDSGGVWPGIKLIEGVKSQEGDIEFGVSRGCLLPRHTILDYNEVPEKTRMKLQNSLILVHGGMAQDVGPILEMVTERYLLRLEREWKGRLKALELFEEILGELKKGNISQLGKLTHENFFGPIQTIIPWASNIYTEAIIERVKAEFGNKFWGFWMLGGMSGGGMGFLFDPSRKSEAQIRLEEIMKEQKKRFEKGIPFAIEPVAYEFSINEKGTWSEILTNADALMPKQYYALMIPSIIRQDPHTITQEQRNELEHFTFICKTNPSYEGMFQQIIDRILPVSSVQSAQDRSLDELLQQLGFDRIQHEQIKTDLRNGRIGLSQNRLPVNTFIMDVKEDEVFDFTEKSFPQYESIGSDAIASGAVAVLTLAAGAGTRWTKGAGTVKALNPFAKFSGVYRTFLETHLAKSRRTNRTFGVKIPHIISTSYLTHTAIQDVLQAEGNYRYEGEVFLSPGRNVGLRLVPTIRDLTFAWQEMPQQLLDEQAQKVLESLHASLMEWSQKTGEASDYIDNLPFQCLHPVGHWYEVPNLFRNGVLAKLLSDYPSVRYLLIHNIDTLGANLDPALLGWQIESKAAMTAEVIQRRIDDRGGGLAKIDGRIRLVEGIALPHEEDEFNLSYYNSATYWIDIDQILSVFGLTRDSLKDEQKVTEAVRTIASRMPTYITLKNVKKRWGKGQEDVYPTLQYEKLWGDMTALPELKCSYVVVPRFRGQQLKEPAQLDGWLRDGSAEYVDSLCEWK
jgi:hypothetical protein